MKDSNVVVATDHEMNHYKINIRNKFNFLRLKKGYKLQETQNEKIVKIH